MSIEPHAFPDDPTRRVVGYSARLANGDVTAKLSCGHVVTVHAPMPPREVRCRTCGEQSEEATT